MSPAVASIPRRAAGKARRLLGRVYRNARRTVGRFVRTNDQPVPPDELMYKVTCYTDQGLYRQQGLLSRRDAERALAVVHDGLDHHRRVLDFGCGPGRVLAWMRDIGRSTDLHGVDIDAAAIDWARQHIPWATFTEIPTWPPMPFEAESFDLVINHSVFSHLPRDYQDAWLEELRRVTAPGAHLCLTVHGEYWFRHSVEQWREGGMDTSGLEHDFDETGLAVFGDDNWQQYFPDYYHTTFHAPWYIFEHWSKYFDIRAYIVRGVLDIQDMIVLKRRDA